MRHWRNGQPQSLAFHAKPRQARQESGTHRLDMWAAGQGTALPQMIGTVGALRLRVEQRQC